MKWENIMTEQRTGTSRITNDPRSEYQRDFDRLIFYSGFRRLQDKTQVFPLPGLAFVHNRLTHSLEVSCVGRSIAKIVGKSIVDINKFDEKITNFYLNELPNVIAAACLAHDIGNPSFGHSGEKAISKYFLKNENLSMNGHTLRSFFDKVEWNDLINFEGNANGFRLLTSNFNGKMPGGLRLTYTTLAATLKYPCESSGINQSIKHRSKYGFFQNEKKLFEEICSTLNMVKEFNDPLSYKRHPFVYLTEAADDICYNMIDLEDAHRVGLIDSITVEKLFRKLAKCLKVYDFTEVEKTVDAITDTNDRISYLRAKCINGLTLKCADRFVENMYEIINGTFKEELFSIIESQCSEMKNIKEIIEEKVYNNASVLKIEIAGYKVLYDLLDLFIPAVLEKSPSHKDKKIRKLIPQQYRVEPDVTDYDKVLSVLDFITGMTDPFATQFYKDVTGIDTTSNNPKNN